MPSQSSGCWPRLAGPPSPCLSPTKLEKALKYSEKCLKAVLRISSKDVEKRERYQTTGSREHRQDALEAGHHSGGREEFQGGPPRSQALGQTPSSGRETGSGTHLLRAGHMDHMVIASEEAIAKGIRRIVALNGQETAKALAKPYGIKIHYTDNKRLANLII